MTLSPWLPLLLAVPVLLLGEWIVRRVRFLHRFNIPAPVVGGLAVSVLVLVASVATPHAIRFGTGVMARWWTWLVTIEPEWLEGPGRTVSFPMMAAFFTCIGLNATRSVVRKGSVQLIWFFALATALAAVQSGVGVGLARALGVDPLLGLVCGSVSMSGGHGTALGFAPTFEEMGLRGAAVLGAAAATAGLVCGGLLGGPVAGRLIRRLGRAPVVSNGELAHAGIGPGAPAGILHDCRAARQSGRSMLAHVLLVLLCLKIGAWASWLIELSGISFTPQIGAMVTGVVIRNVWDMTGRPWIRSEVIDVISSISLGLFLAIAMMTLNLLELANAALPMLVIIAVQVAVTALFATFVTYACMGRDYDAAVMAGGHCGFGLGATPNAVANMKALVERFGAAPRAFLVVPVVGGILIDFTNSLVITFFINVVR